MKKSIIKIASIFCIVLYLIIPFKSQFLTGLHTLSHISLSQDHHHHHNHYFNDHDHHHGWLASISISLDNQNASNALPENLAKYKFESPFPSDYIQLKSLNLADVTRKFYSHVIPILIGPFFKVPTPPP